MDSPSIAPSPPDSPARNRHASVTGILLAVALVIYGWILGTHTTALPGGSDSSGYFNQARLLSAGAVHVSPRAIPSYAPAERLWVYSPLGFKPMSDRDGIVPTYPTGLPLWIAASAKLVGWNEAATVVLWLHGVAGVALLYAAGRIFGLGRGACLAGAAILATAPVYLFFSVQTMSDVPALVWVLATVVCAWRSDRSAFWAAIAGVAFAMAVLLRPTNALALVPVAIALGRRPTAWLAFGAGGVPGAIFFATYNHVAYGGWLTTGYGQLELSRVWIVPTLRHYAVWLGVVFSPAIVGFLLLPWAGRGRARLAWMLALWFVVFAGFYSAYNCTHETWWYLRFLLPAAPALILGSVLGYEAIATRWPARRNRQIGIAAVILAIGCNVAWARHWLVLRVGEDEQKYRQTSQWLQQRIPKDAVVACMQQSGALFFDTDFTIVRWDFLNHSDFDALTAVLAKQRRPLYAALFPFEIEAERAFERHLSGGHWTKIGQVREITIWQWSQNAAP